VQEKRNDLSVHVQRVRHKTRPWKWIIALLLAIAAVIVSHTARSDSHFLFTAGHRTNQLVASGSAVLFLIFGIIATYGLAAKARDVLEPKMGTSHAAVVRYAVLVVGGFTTLVITLVLLGVAVAQLVLGGALTTVFVSIAAQQALGNVFAGMVLLLARPFRVGDAVRLRAGALGGTLDGVVTDIGITYMRFRTDDSVMSIPNSQVLNAVVGPVPPNGGNGVRAPAVSGSTPGPPGAPEQPQPSPPGPV
jgi:small-conductance mechanosensitive channel